MTLSRGTDCFVLFDGRCYRGKVTGLPCGEGFVQVRTEAASRVCDKWGCLSFNVNTRRGTYADKAELILPQSIAEWAEYGELADLGSARPIVARELCAYEAAKPEPALAPKRMWLPYADASDNEDLIMKPPAGVVLPEGYEPGEKLT